MPFTHDQIAHRAVVFPQEHLLQIIAKSAQYHIPQEDICQDVSLIIIEKAASFEPEKGTFPQFVFGHWEKRRLSQTGAHTYAISLDRDDATGEAARDFIQTVTDLDLDDSHASRMHSQTYEAKILAIADQLSGKSSAEFAQSRGVTPRYVRRALQTLRETGKIPALFEEGWKRKPRQPVNQVEAALALVTNKAREGNQAIRSNSRCDGDIDAAAHIPECSSFE